MYHLYDVKQVVPTTHISLNVKGSLGEKRRQNVIVIFGTSLSGMSPSLIAYITFEAICYIDRVNF
jgi:hypothetical protein